jgi:tRNA 2-thiouridine synthesizing protein B
MKTLHTLNSSSRDQRALFDRMIQFSSPGDSLLLIENGVYCITDEYAMRTAHATGLQIFCLQNDIEARGLSDYVNIPAQQNTCELVDDSGFVALSCTHNKVLSWFV